MSEELRKTIMDAMRSVSERADEFKAGCATFDGEWPDAEDKAIYDAEVALVERLRVALAALPSDAAQAPIRWLSTRADQWGACRFEKSDSFTIPVYAAPVAADAAAPTRTYTTQAGESVAGIALRQCGNDAEWQSILACNPQFEDLHPNDYFPVGTVLTMPPGAQGDELPFTKAPPAGVNLLPSLTVEDADDMAAQPDERAAFEAWFAAEWEKYPDKAFTDKIIAKAWALKSARSTAPQATVKGDAPTGFDISLASVDAYDPQSFINGAKWMQARAAVPQSVKGGERHCFTCGRQIEAASAAAPQAGATLTEEVIAEAVKKWFPDRSYQASFFARALLSSQAEK